ncbi:hypothetical protein Cgig2_007981 [Carnegiea gigantea]|uniref:Uncharacterized protein n=1 Tax=Carnegiea gigantea TaxID=171969 RepID=A0A9Q1GN02_9CARY|nr:hypothetical protein Cgig2_007981 [Carnegiea gigantea]
MTYALDRTIFASFPTQRQSLGFVPKKCFFDTQVSFPTKKRKSAEEASEIGTWNVEQKFFFYHLAFDQYDAIALFFRDSRTHNGGHQILKVQQGSSAASCEAFVSRFSSNPPILRQGDAEEVTQCLGSSRLCSKANHFEDNDGGFSSIHQMHRSQS